MKRELEKELIAWQGRKEHLPILLRGARQVGKSYLVEEFGAAQFDDVMTVDFERKPELKKIFATREPREIAAQLEFVFQRPIRAGHTLLFFDEVQFCPEVLIALRYFKEQMPGLHIIAAGSLLEFLLHAKDFSFPVGRVEFLYLHPLSFREYLEEAAPFLHQRLSRFTLQHPPSSLEHQELLKWVRRYLFIGGMPTAVQSSFAKETLLDCQRIHYRILQAYESDFGKYAQHVQHPHLRTIFHKAPIQVGKIVKYAHLDDGVRSRDLKPALELLCHAGLFQQIFATTAAGIPLHAHLKEHRFKLLYLDVGLLQTMAKVDATLFFQEEIVQINAGMIAEQFVGQELLAYAPAYQHAPLLFWEREKGAAEIDFVMTVGSEIIPIEVKAGKTGTLRSLHSFLQEKKERKLGVRISEHLLALQGNILSVPFYLIGFLEPLVRDSLSRLERVIC